MGHVCYHRYDYEDCEIEACNEMMAALNSQIHEPGFVGKSLSHGTKSFKVALADDFEYTDPIDGSVAKNQV